MQKSGADLQLIANAVKRHRTEDDVPNVQGSRAVYNSVSESPQVRNFKNII